MRGGLLFLLAGCAPTAPAPELVPTAPDVVTVDFEMAARAIDWLELAETGAGEGELHERFFAEVASTEGCRVIVRHWARFREWNEELFFQFVMKGLGRMHSPEPLVDENGNRTRYGTSRALWGRALADPAALRADLDALRAADPAKSALALARSHLPPEANVTNDFYVLLFGGSSAFSVGDANGFDLLQLPKRTDGTLDVDEVVATFAHEMHHSGFADVSHRHMGAVADADELNLVGVLAAEGTATELVSRTHDRLDELRDSHDTSERELAADWDRHLARLDELYLQAQADIRENLRDELTTDELIGRWLGGMQGPAYIVGADMCATIEGELGHAAVLEVIRDYRKFLELYNRAVALANARDGANRFAFDTELADEVAAFAGASG